MIGKINSLLILSAFVIIFAGCKTDEEITAPAEGERGYQTEVRDSDGYKFLLFMPASDAQMVNGKYPAIIFLHGIGERGSDLQILKKEGLPKILDGDKNFPFIVISPQCPATTEWYYSNENNVGKMESMIADVIRRYPVDTSRIYLTGLSMGGIATWYFALKVPGRFAAIAPAAFRGDGWSPCSASPIPVWAFHGALDNVIPLQLAQNLVDQFKACGGNIKFTVYPDLYHDCWTRTYSNPQLYTWFLQNRKQ